MSNAAKRTERVFITTLPTHPAYPCSSLNRPTAVGFDDFVIFFHFVHEADGLLDSYDDAQPKTTVVYTVD